MKKAFYVLSDHRRFIGTENIDGTYPYPTATRAVRQHSGWQSVAYSGRRFQLFGGIRTPFFINEDRPIEHSEQEETQ